MSKLVDSICRELSLQKDFLEGEKVETIYFGGGSPSLLSMIELQKIMDSIAKNFSTINSPEITFEGNPDDLNFSYLKSLSSLGINRLSIGIQSFDEKALKFLNRVHSADQSIDCLKDAVKAGFDNFNIDLIYGIPNKDHSVFRRDLEFAMEIVPKHISAYCLTIEEKTAFGNWLKKGKLAPIDDDFASEQYEILVSTLAEYQYEQYEISNFAIPDFYSKHNSNYWRNVKYLGVGPGAHSYNGWSRRFNIENNQKYIEALDRNTLPYTIEELSTENRINEYILTTLRTKWGCSILFLKENYNLDLLQRSRDKINKLITDGYLIYDNERLYLTQKGKLIADKITEELWVTF